MLEVGEKAENSRSFFSVAVDYVIVGARVLEYCITVFVRTVRSGGGEKSKKCRVWRAAPKKGKEGEGGGGGVSLTEQQRIP
jgi:hypothetical protein